MADEIEPLVAVVVPTLNGHARMANTLRCIAAQVVGPVELIVVDDGSPIPIDEELVLGHLGHWAVEGATVKVVRNQSPLGVATARNVGLEAVTAKWVAFCDDDDLWVPGKLAAQLHAVDAGGEWAISSAIGVFEDLRPYRNYEAAPRSAQQWTVDLFEFNSVPGGGSGVLVRTSLLRELGGFDATSNQYADWDLNLRLALRGGAPSCPPGAVIAKVHHPARMTAQLGELSAELELMHQRWQSERDRAGLSGRDYRHRGVCWLAAQACQSGPRALPMIWRLPASRRERLKWSVRTFLDPSARHRAVRYRLRTDAAKRQRATAALESIRAIVEPIRQ
jgi:glycosyltransferase involved in cell wall biosynthesis